MKKFKEMKNNKGFSLVELIVVIAIMVVLVAVLGSTILGYVEKSKYSKDIQALDSVKTAISTYVADPECNYVNGTAYTLDKFFGNDASGKPMDPNKVIYKTLQEVFSFTTSGSGSSLTVTGGTLNADSTAFSGIALTDIYVYIKDGAVSIVAPVNAADKDNFDPYIAGEYYKDSTNLGNKGVKNATP